jgi:Xaa-Pro dipeptidase
MLDIKAIQEKLKEHNLDGWLLADFHGRNTVATQMLSITGMITRRSFYLIPAEGDPTGLVNPVEQHKFHHLPGRIVPCFGYTMLEEKLKETIKGMKCLGMEYSPSGRLPYIGLVDAGTIELVRSFGAEIVSSADLVADFQARLSDEQIKSHRQAAANLIEIKEAAFDFVAQHLKNGSTLCEFDVVKFILDRFDVEQMETASPPICAIGANAGNPHYEPTAEKSDAIVPDQLLLIDLWAKLKQPMAVYADITWMGATGGASALLAHHREMFAILTSARDRAVAFLNENLKFRDVRGAEVDDACRQVIVEAGFGEFFVHRTGHSITTSEHGPGPNIDNLETEDRRALKSGHLFSIEPGLYRPDIGMRTEIDVLIVGDTAEVTTLPLQTEIKSLL